MEKGDDADVTFGRRAKEELPRKSTDKNKEKPAKGILSGTYDDEVYSMQYKKIGKCLIFNHKTFTYDVDDRPYSDLDANALENFFHLRGFDVEVYPDRKVSQIYAILEEESKTEYHNDASCFVCCVLTHGKLKENQEYLCANDNIYPTECLFAPFSGDRCEPLAGKPKIFFIQACRGDDFDPGVNVFYKLLGLINLFPAAQASPPQENNSRHISEPLLCCKIPVKADFLIAYSTAIKFIAWKRNEKGSWFIQTLCEVLKKRADDSDLLSMLTVVCRRVAYEYESDKTGNTDTDKMKQVPSTYSTLTKMVKFPSPRKIV